MQHLRILAGPAARDHIAREGLSPGDVRAVAGAAGGPKGLVLNALDRFLFGEWFSGEGPLLHLVGASIGAVRLACAATSDPDAALARFARRYIEEEYEPPAGERQSAANIGRRYRELIESMLGEDFASALAHPRKRLHVVADRGRRLLRSETPGLFHLGLALLVAGNRLDRRCVGAWLERVIFSDPRSALPLALTDLPTRHALLAPGNLRQVVLASASIPLWFPAVQGIPGAPEGCYWDGGMTDYQLHWPWSGWREAGREAIVLFPHYEARLVPGWLDKKLIARHAPGPGQDNVVLLAPSPSWVAALPGGALPDRNDFRRMRREPGRRRAAWSEAVARSELLAADLAQWLQRGCPISDVEVLGTA